MDQTDQVVLVLWADLDQAPLGQPSKLLTALNGTAVLPRTVQRAAAVKNVADRIVFCPSDQHERVKAILSDLPVRTVAAQFERPLRWPGVQAARKWAKASWRGGLLGACGFDEDVLPDVLHAIATQVGASAVLSVPAHAALVDPQLLDRQIEQYLEHRDEFKLCFTQAPPGLAGVVVETELLGALAQGSQLLGSSLVYHPENPKPDIIAKPCNLPIDPAIIQTPARLVCDSARSFALIEAMLAHLPEEKLTAEIIAKWVQAHGAAHLSRWPEEIEIELVGAWPTPRSYRPRPDKRRGPIAIDPLIERIAEITCECDDLLVRLGGFGEPTQHAQLDQIVKRLKEVGVWGVTVATTGLFDEPTAHTLVDLPIDIVLVLLDVPDPALYAKVMGADRYSRAVETIDRVLQLRHQKHQALPLVVTEMIKTNDTLELMDAFYDGWLRRIGGAVISGYCDYAGQLPDLAVSTMAPPNRRACRRLFSRLTILADGTVVSCDMDFKGIEPLGSIATDSLLDLWRDGGLAQLRQAHLEGRYDANNLCPACQHWHRP